MNASRAALRSMEPRSPGSCPATPKTPPRVSLAASCAPGGTPAGMAPAISVRYMAVPMLPRIAMLSAPPSSAVVSEIADAAPARSGGADPTTRLVASVKTGARPREEMASPVAMTAKEVSPSIWASSPKPIAASARPPASPAPGGSCARLQESV